MSVATIKNLDGSLGLRCIYVQYYLNNVYVYIGMYIIECYGMQYNGKGKGFYVFSHLYRCVATLGSLECIPIYPHNGHPMGIPIGPTTLFRSSRRRLVIS